MSTTKIINTKKKKFHRKKRYKVSMRDAWFIQKELNLPGNTVMSYFDLANHVAEQMGWPQIHPDQEGAKKDFPRQYLARYLIQRKRSLVHYPRSWVYIVQCAGHVKIGVSDNVQARIDQMKVGNPFKIKLIATIGCEGRKKAFALEKKIHELFYDYRKDGEWFVFNCVFKLNDIPIEEEIDWADKNWGDQRMIDRVHRSMVRLHNKMKKIEEINNNQLDNQTLESIPTNF